MGSKNLPFPGQFPRSRGSCWFKLRACRLPAVVNARRFGRGGAAATSDGGGGFICSLATQRLLRRDVGGGGGATISSDGVCSVPQRCRPT